MALRQRVKDVPIISLFLDPLTNSLVMSVCKHGSIFKGSRSRVNIYILYICIYCIYVHNKPHNVHDGDKTYIQMSVHEVDE